MPGYAYQAGDHIGSYRVVDEVANSDTQQVYLVHDNKRDRELVLRLAAAATSDPEDATVADDARKARQLSHPSVAVIVDLGVHDGHRYVVSEAVDGTRLDRWLDGERTWRDIARVFEQIARGLASAHSEGLVRQTFAPEHAVVSQQRVRIVDLGLASSSPPIDDGDNQTAVSRVMFEALHKTDPMGEGHKQPPRPPVDSEVPQSIHRAVVKGLASDSAHRFADLSALANELAQGRADKPRGMAGKLAIAGVALLAIATVGYFAIRGDGGEPNKKAAKRPAASQTQAKQPAPTSNQSAEEAFAEATAAFDAGRFLEAGKMYQAGYSAHRKEAFLWNAGLAYKQAGAYCQFYEVAALYEQVLPEDTELREKQMAMGVRAEAQTLCQRSMAGRQGQPR